MLTLLHYYKEVFMVIKKYLLCFALGLTISACSAGTSNYQNEFNGIGNTQTASMSNDDLRKAIDHAYLDGELTAEQARKAHIQLDVKGHLTAEQIAVINRDRLAQRSKYETNKENLDVIRDVGQTGSSVLSDVYNMKNTINSIFR